MIHKNNNNQGVFLELLAAAKNMGLMENGKAFPPNQIA